MTITEKLINIQSRLKAPKNQYNKFGNYAYRSAEDILEALKPLLKEEEVALTITDEIAAVGDRIYVKATATIMDKENNIIDAIAYAREPETQKGMNEAQITGSASSYARKYALNGLFAIDDNKDADSQDNRDQQPNNNQNPNLITEPQAKRLFAIAKDPKLVKAVIEKRGYSSTKDIKRAEYDLIVKEIEGYIIKEGL